MGEPLANKRDEAEAKLKEIKLVVVDIESEKSRVCGIDEARGWDWGNPELVRMVVGWQVTSFEELVQVLLYKVAKGYQEVKIYESPRSMLLGGG